MKVINTYKLIGITIIISLFQFSCTSKKSVSTGDVPCEKGDRYKLVNHNFNSRYHIKKDISTSNIKYKKTEVLKTNHNSKNDVVTASADKTVITPILKIKKEIIKLNTFKPKHDIKNKARIKSVEKVNKKKKKLNGYALASLLTLITPFLFITIPASQILSLVALDQLKKEPKTYNNGWMAYFVSSVWCVASTIGVFATLFMFAWAGNPMYLFVAGLSIGLIVLNIMMMSKGYKKPDVPTPNQPKIKKDEVKEVKKDNNEIIYEY